MSVDDGFMLLTTATLMSVIGRMLMLVRLL